MEDLIRDGSPLEVDNVEDVALDLSQAQIGITHANFVVPINDFAPNDPREGDLSQDPDGMQEQGYGDGSQLSQVVS